MEPWLPYSSKRAAHKHLDGGGCGQLADMWHYSEVGKVGCQIRLFSPIRGSRPGREGRTEPAELEHGEGDERRMRVESEGESGEEPELRIHGFDSGV